MHLMRVVLVCFAALTACTGGGGAPVDAAGKPPAVIVRGGGRVLRLRPYTYCWVRMCADGFRPRPLPGVGSPGRVVIEFAEPGWTFDASLRSEERGDCARTFSTTLTPLGDGRFQLLPQGAAGAYDVSLFGRSGRGAARGGDVFVAFRWTTTRNGPVPRPRAEISVLADHDGRTDSYGVEAALTNLRETPISATERVTVTAANGNSRTIDLRRDDRPCRPGPERAFGRAGLPDGSVGFSGDAADGLAAAKLGPPPFTYEVVLELDGVRHVAHATWPDDVDGDCSPCVPLRFTPPLPAPIAGHEGTGSAPAP